MELKLIERGDLKFTQIKVGVKEYEDVCKPVGEAQRLIQNYNSSAVQNWSSYTLVCGLIVDMIPIKKNSKFIYYMFEGDLLNDRKSYEENNSN